MPERTFVEWQTCYSAELLESNTVVLEFLPVFSGNGGRHCGVKPL